MKKVLTTPLGTFLKGFISSVLTLWMAYGNDLFSLDMDMVRKIAGAALVSNLPVIINWLNPQYVQYGVTNDDSGSADTPISGAVTVIIFFIALTALVSACNP